MPESFAQDAAEIGYPPDWDGPVSSQEEHLDRATATEVASTLSFDELRDAILCDLWDNSFYTMRLLDQCYRGEGYTLICALDGLNSESEILDSYYFSCIVGQEEHEFSARFLMQVLSDSGLPLFHEGADTGWVAWDPSRGSLSVHSYGRATSLEDIRAKEYAKNDARAARLLERCRVSLDHGQKPILIVKGGGKNLRSGQRVPFLAPEAIREEEFEQYELAYVSASGAVEIIDFSRVARLRQPIPTRACLYDVSDDGFASRLDFAFLLSSAFTLAVSRHPDRLGCFQRVASGSIYQSSIVGVQIPKIHDSFMSDEPVLAMAESLRAFTDQFGDVYLTSGLHPFDGYSQHLLPEFNHWVTTPDLLGRAIRTIEESAFYLKYTFSSVAVIPGDRDKVSF
jgi:hypothetical protein